MLPGAWGGAGMDETVMLSLEGWGEVQQEVILEGWGGGQCKEGPVCMREQRQRKGHPKANCCSP